MRGLLILRLLFNIIFLFFLNEPFYIVLDKINRSSVSSRVFIIADFALHGLLEWSKWIIVCLLLCGGGTGMSQLGVGLSQGRGSLAAFRLVAASFLR